MDADHGVVIIRLLGNAQLGLLLSSGLWGIASLQAVTYYRNFKSDMDLVKVAVGVTWLADTMYIILSAAIQYQFMHGNISFSLIPVVLACAAVMQSVVQIAYAFRLYSFGKQPWILLICCTGAAYEFVTIVLYGVLVLNQNFLVNQIKYRWIITSSYVVCPIVDIMITGTFCYQLRKDRQYLRRRTARILDKLVLWAIQSGLITSLTAITIVIMDFTFLEDGPFLVLVEMIWPLYPVTLLALLNGRSQLRSMNEKANDEITTFNLGIHTDTQGELHPGKSIPNIPIEQQATDGSSATCKIPETGINTYV